MDFSVLVADLRDVAEKYKGKTTEPQVSTVVYVDMFTKILQRAERLISKYEDQIMMLWVALNQLAVLYKDLAAGSARDQLSRFIFGMCARTVLNIQWPQLDEDNNVRQNFCKTVENVHEILAGLGFSRFQLILDLMENHWTHPTLTKIMSGDEEEEIEDGLEYIQNQDPEILKLRIEIMMKENCEEFALNLCTWSLKHAQLKNDLKIKEHQIVIMYKQQMFGKMQEVCESIVCHDGIKVMAHLAKNPSNQSLCIRLAQIFLVQDWIKPDRNCCTQELLKLWIHHQYLDDKDEERFLESIWAVAKVSRSTEQIGVLIDGVRKECGDTFIQLYTELCKYAINIDKGNMEKELEKDNLEAVKERQFAIAKTCVRMAYMLKEYDFRISKICGLTAFSLDCTFDSLNLVNRLYWTVKNTTATSDESKINPATLYEIERLLEPMRPNVLDPEFTWKKIIPLCKKYKTERDVLLKESCQYVPVLSDPAASIKYFKRASQTATASGSVTGTAGNSNSKTEMLKKPTAVDIDRLLGHKFPRDVLKGKSMADFTMKDLDKTINDLKKSINEETEYRKKLQLERLEANKKSEKKPRTPSVKKESKEPSVKKERVMKSNNLIPQTVQNLNETNVNALGQQSNVISSTTQWQRSQSLSDLSHFQSFNSAESITPPVAHRNVSTPISPPVSHHGSPSFRSPPIAHANHPPSSARNVLSPQSSGSSQFHSPSCRQNSTSGQFSSGYTHVSVGQTASNMKSISSSASHPANTRYTASDILKQSLSNKIQSDQLKKTVGLPNSVSSNMQSVSGSVLQRQNSAPNLITSGSAERRPYTLEYSTAASSPAECAKIAQQIAQMHLKQRAERERVEGKKQRKPRQKKETPKTSLTSKSIPSRSQISELLSQTIKANTQNSVERNVQNIIQIRNKILQAENQTVANNAHHQKTSAYDTANLNTQKTPSAQDSRFSGAFDGQNEIKSQKLYLTSASVIDKLKKDKTGVVNLSESKGFSVKPVFSMVVPRALTSPANQEELVRRVTNMVKKATLSKENNSAVGTAVPSTHSQMSNLEPAASVAKPKNVDLATEEVKSTPVPDHVLEFLKSRSKSEQNPPKIEQVNRTVVRTVSVTPFNQNENSLSSQSVSQPQIIPSRARLPPQTPTDSQVMNNAASQITALTGIVLPQTQASLNMLATVASNSVALTGQQLQNEVPVSFENQSQIPTQPAVSIYNQPPQNLFQSMSQQPNRNTQSQRLPVPVLQPTIPLQQTVISQQPPVVAASGQPNPENRIRLPVTSEQSEQRFMHVFDQFGNKQIVNMTPQPHLVHTSVNDALSIQNSQAVQFQPIAGIQNSLPQQLTQNSGLVSIQSGSTAVVPTASTMISNSAANTCHFTNNQTQVQPETLVVSNSINNETPQNLMSPSRQQFNIVPELSPAVVQQILTDLMKTGSQQDLSSASRRSSEKDPQPSQLFNKQDTDIFPISQGNQGPEKTKQLTNTNDAANFQQLVAKTSLADNYRAVTIQNSTSHHSMHSTNNLTHSSGAVNGQCFSASSSKTSNRLTTSKVINPSTSYRSITTRPGSSNSLNNVPVPFSHATAASQFMQVPDLPDLGRKEFGIDEILRTESNIELNTQRSNSAEQTSGKEAVVHKNVTNLQIQQERDQLDKNVEMESHDKSKERKSNQIVLQIQSDGDIKRVESFLVNETNCAKSKSETTEQKENRGKVSTLAKENVWSTNNQNKVPSSLQDTVLTHQQQFISPQTGSEKICDQKQQSQNTKYDNEQQPGKLPEVNSLKTNCQTDITQSRIVTSQSTFFNAARLAKEREERERDIKFKQEKKTAVPQNSDKAAGYLCGTCFIDFDSLEKLKEHVKLNGCPSKICTICETVFPSLEKLKMHLKFPCSKGTKQAKEKTKDFEYTKIFVCSKCNFTSQNEKIGTKHVENCNVSSSPIKAKVTIWYKCHMCKEVLHDKDLAYRHISRFCPQLKALKAMKDVQKSMDKIKNKDTLYRDPKSFIQGCFLPEISKTEIENKKLSAELHEKRKEDTDTDISSTKQIKEVISQEKSLESLAVRQPIKPEAKGSDTKDTDKNLFNMCSSNTLSARADMDESVRQGNRPASLEKEGNNTKKMENLRSKKQAESEKPGSNDAGEINRSSIKSGTKHRDSSRQELPEKERLRQKVKSPKTERCTKTLKIENRKQSVTRSKTDEIPVNEATSTCKLCLYSTKVDRSLVRHYTQAHDFGFKMHKKRYRCKYCDVSFHSSSKIMIKGHMMKHADILLKQIAKSKHLNRELPFISENNEKSVYGSMVEYSPRRVEKVKRHMKARAARSKCAENLRKLSVIQNPSLDQEEPEKIGKTERSFKHKNSKSQLAEKVMGRPRKYPAGEEPYLYDKARYRRERCAGWKFNKKKTTRKEKHHEKEVHTEVQSETYARLSNKSRSRSNSVSSNASMQDSGRKTRRSQGKEGAKLDEGHETGGKMRIEVRNKGDSIERDSASLNKVSTRSQTGKITFKSKMDAKEYSDEDKLSHKEKYIKSKNISSPGYIENDAGINSLQIRENSDKYAVVKKVEAVKYENDQKEIIIGTTAKNTNTRCRSLRSRPNSSSSSSAVDTSESDSEPITPLKKRLRNRKELTDDITEISKSKISLQQNCEKKPIERNTFKGGDEPPRKTCVDSSELLEGKPEKSLPCAKIADKMQENYLKDSSGRKKLKTEENKRITQQQNVRSDDDESVNVKRSLRPRKSQVVVVDSEEENDVQTDRRKATRRKRSPDTYTQSDADVDDSSEDDSDVIPLRKRLRRRSGQVDWSEQESNLKTSQQEIKHNKYNSKIIGNKSHEKKRVSETEMSDRNSIEKACQTTIEYIKNAYDFSVRKKRTSKNQRLLDSSDSESTTSESDSGRATPIRERLRQRKNSKQEEKETPLDSGVKENIQDKVLNTNTNKDQKDSEELVENDTEQEVKKYHLRDRNKCDSKGKDDALQGDIQASIDVIFDAMEEEFATLTASANIDNDVVDESIPVEKDAKKCAATEVKPSSEKPRKVDAQKRSYEPKPKIKYQEKYTEDKQTDDSCENAKCENFKSLSVLVDPDDNYVSAESSSVSGKSSGQKLCRKQDSSDAKIPNSKDNIPGCVILENEDEFSFVKSDNSISVVEDKTAIVSTRKDVEMTISKQTENFDTEFLKFTQKRLLKDHDSSSESDSSLEIQKNIEKVAPEMKKTCNQEKKNTSDMPVISSDKANQDVAKAETHLAFKADESTSNFAAVFKAFAGVETVDSTDKRSSTNQTERTSESDTVKQVLTKPVPPTKKDTLKRDRSAEAEQCEQKLQQHKSKCKTDSLKQTGMAVEAVTETQTLNKNKHLNHKSNMENRTSLTIDVDTKSPSQKHVSSCDQMKKKTGFEGAYEEFYKKTCELRNPDPRRKQDFLTETNLLNEKTADLKKTELNHKQLLALKESLPECSVSISRLSNEEISKYKKLERKEMKEKQPVEIIVLDSDDESQDETDFIILNSEESLTSTEENDVRKGQNHNITTTTSENNVQATFLSSNCVESGQTLSKDLLEDNAGMNSQETADQQVRNTSVEDAFKRDSTDEKERVEDSFDQEVSRTEKRQEKSEKFIKLELKETVKLQKADILQEDVAFNECRSIQYENESPSVRETASEIETVDKKRTEESLSTFNAVLDEKEVESAENKVLQDHLAASTACETIMTSASDKASSGESIQLVTDDKKKNTNGIDALENKSVLNESKSAKRQQTTGGIVVFDNMCNPGDVDLVSSEEENSDKKQMFTESRMSGERHRFSESRMVGFKIQENLINDAVYQPSCSASEKLLPTADQLHTDTDIATSSEESRLNGSHFKTSVNARSSYDIDQQTSSEREDGIASSIETVLSDNSFTYRDAEISSISETIQSSICTNVRGNIKGSARITDDVLENKILEDSEENHSILFHSSNNENKLNNILDKSVIFVDAEMSRISENLQSINCTIIQNEIKERKTEVHIPESAIVAETMASLSKACITSDKESNTTFDKSVVFHGAEISCISETQQSAYCANDGDEIKDTEIETRYADENEISEESTGNVAVIYPVKKSTNIKLHNSVAFNATEVSSQSASWQSTNCSRVRDETSETETPNLPEKMEIPESEKNMSSACQISDEENKLAIKNYMKGQETSFHEFETMDEVLVPDHKTPEKQGCPDVLMVEVTEEKHDLTDVCYSSVVSNQSEIHSRDHHLLKSCTASMSRKAYEMNDKDCTSINMVTTAILPHSLFENEKQSASDIESENIKISKSEKRKEFQRQETPGDLSPYEEYDKASLIVLGAKQRESKSEDGCSIGFTMSNSAKDNSSSGTDGFCNQGNNSDSKLKGFENRIEKSIERIRRSEELPSSESAYDSGILNKEALNSSDENMKKVSQILMEIPIWGENEHSRQTSVGCKTNTVAGAKVTYVQEQTVKEENRFENLETTSQDIKNDLEDKTLLKVEDEESNFEGETLQSSLQNSVDHILDARMSVCKNNSRAMTVDDNDLSDDSLIVHSSALIEFTEAPKLVSYSDDESEPEKFDSTTISISDKKCQGATDKVFKSGEIQSPVDCLQKTNELEKVTILVDSPVVQKAISVTEDEDHVIESEKAVSACTLETVSSVEENVDSEEATPVVGTDVHDTIEMENPVESEENSSLFVTEMLPVKKNTSVSADLINSETTKQLLVEKTAAVSETNTSSDSDKQEFEASKQLRNSWHLDSSSSSIRNVDELNLVEVSTVLQTDTSGASDKENFRKVEDNNGITTAEKENADNVDLKSSEPGEHSVLLHLEKHENISMETDDKFGISLQDNIGEFSLSYEAHATVETPDNKYSTYSPRPSVSQNASVAKTSANLPGVCGSEDFFVTKESRNSSGIRDMLKSSTTGYPELLEAHHMRESCLVKSEQTSVRLPADSEVQQKHLKELENTDIIAACNKLFYRMDSQEQLILFEAEYEEKLISEFKETSLYVDSEEGKGNKERHLNGQFLKEFELESAHNISAQADILEPVGLIPGIAERTEIMDATHRPEELHEPCIQIDSNLSQEIVSAQPDILDPVDLIPVTAQSTEIMDATNRPEESHQPCIEIDSKFSQEIESPDSVNKQKDVGQIDSETASEDDTVQLDSNKAKHLEQNIIVRSIASDSGNTSEEELVQYRNDKESENKFKSSEIKVPDFIDSCSADTAKDIVKASCKDTEKAVAPLGTACIKLAGNAAIEETDKSFVGLSNNVKEFHTSNTDQDFSHDETDDCGSQDTTKKTLEEHVHGTKILEIKCGTENKGSAWTMQKVFQDAKLEEQLEDLQSPCTEEAAEMGDNLDQSSKDSHECQTEASELEDSYKYKTEASEPLITLQATADKKGAITAKDIIFDDSLSHTDHVIQSPELETLDISEHKEEQRLVDSNSGYEAGSVRAEQNGQIYHTNETEYAEVHERKSKELKEKLYFETADKHNDIENISQVIIPSDEVYTMKVEASETQQKDDDKQRQLSNTPIGLQKSSQRNLEESKKCPNDLTKHSKEVLECLTGLAETQGTKMVDIVCSGDEIFLKSDQFVAEKISHIDEIFILGESKILDDSKILVDSISCESGKSDSLISDSGDSPSKRDSEVILFAKQEISSERQISSDIKGVDMKENDKVITSQIDKSEMNLLKSSSEQIQIDLKIPPGICVGQTEEAIIQESATVTNLSGTLKESYQDNNPDCFNNENLFDQEKNKSLLLAENVCKDSSNIIATSTCQKEAILPETENTDTDSREDTGYNILSNKEMLNISHAKEEQICVNVPVADEASRALSAFKIIEQSCATNSHSKKTDNAEMLPKLSEEHAINSDTDNMTDKTAQEAKDISLAITIEEKSSNTDLLNSEAEMARKSETLDVPKTDSKCIKKYVEAKLTKNKSERSVSTKSKTRVKESFSTNVEEVDKEEMEEFNKRTETVKQSLKKLKTSKGKAYESDFNFEEDDDVLSTCSNSSSGTSFSSLGLEIDSLKVVASSSRTVSPFSGLEPCSSPQKNTVSTMTARIGGRKTYYSRNNLVSKSGSDKTKKYSGGTNALNMIPKDQSNQALVSDIMNEFPDKNLLPTNSYSERKVSLPKLAAVTNQYARFSLSLRDEPESPRSVSSESNSGTESIDSGTKDIEDQTLHPLRAFRKIHSDKTPFMWDLDYDSESSDQKNKNNIEQEKNSTKCRSTRSDSVDTSDESKSDLLLQCGKRRLSAPETVSLQTKSGQQSKHMDNKDMEVSESKTQVHEEGRKRLRSPSASKQAVKANTGKIVSSKAGVKTASTLSSSKEIQRPNTKDKQNQNFTSHNVQENQYVRASRRRSVDSADTSGTIGRMEKGDLINITRAIARSSSSRHLIEPSTSVPHENFATDVDGSIIVADLANKGISECSRLVDSLETDSLKDKMSSSRGLKRKSGHIEVEDSIKSKPESKQIVHKGHSALDKSKSITRSHDLSKQVSSNDKATEPNSKQSKLDTNKVANESDDDGAKAGSCTCQLDNTFCEDCKFKEKAVGTKNVRVTYKQHKPAVRRLLHGGKVFEIQKGSITETDIASTSANSTPVSRDISPQPGEPKMKNRLVSLSPSESPKKKKSRTVKSDDSGDLSETSLFVKTGADLNDYIHATLKEIRKQRQLKQPIHYLRQPKTEADADAKWKLTRKDGSEKYPYSFKRSRPTT